MSRLQRFEDPGEPLRSRGDARRIRCNEDIDQADEVLNDMFLQSVRESGLHGEVARKDSQLPAERFGSHGFPRLRKRYSPIRSDTKRFKGSALERGACPSRFRFDATVL